MEGGELVATATAVPREIIDALANEVGRGVDQAVEYWMLRIEHALNRADLTSLGRLYAVKDIVEEYKDLKGKEEKEVRRA
jgi:predicted nuclease with TOPRIM domain